MKNIIYIAVTALALCVAPLAASAQSNDFGYGGYIMTRYGFSSTDMHEMSKFDYGMATARSAAMGGAFTSLGGDLASIGINPAGLGMYRTSEISVTPAFTMNKVTHNVTANGANNDNRFGFANFGGAFNVYEGTGGLTSFTFGISMNRIADYNFKRGVKLPTTNGASVDPTITEALAALIYGVYDPSSVSSGGIGSRPLQDWNSILAYRAGLIVSDGTDKGYASLLDADTHVSRMYHTIVKGRADEFALAGGFNFRNNFYFGFSVGIVDIWRDEDVLYSEDFYNTGSDNRFKGLDIGQVSKYRGSGFNVKLGAVYRPIDQLRIGVSVHTPTWIVADRSYYTYVEGLAATGSNTFGDADNLGEDYKFTTPARVMAGVSYTFGNIGVISADYECAWYNGMRVRNSSFEDAMKNEIKDWYKPEHSVKLGAEVKPVPTIALRAGFGYSASSKQNHYDNAGIEEVLNAPVNTSSTRISAGAGFRITPSFSVDLAYVYGKYKYSTYDLYWFVDGDASAFDGNLDFTRNKHSALMTLAFRF